MKSLFYRILNAGVSHTKDFMVRKRVRLTNLLGIYAFVIYFLFIASAFYTQSLFILSSAIVMIAVTLFGFWCNDKGYFSLSKTIYIVGSSSVLFITYNVINISESILLFYFLIFLTHSVLYEAKKERKTLIFNFFYCALTILLAFFLPRNTLGTVILPEARIKVLDVFNVLGAAAMFMIFLYIIARSNFIVEQRFLYAWKTSKQQTLQLEEARKKAEVANRAKSNFLSNMSHELRTPLNGIIGTTNLIISENNNPQLQEKYNILNHCSEYMLGLVNDILDFSKLEAGKIVLDKQPLNIRKLITELEELFRPSFAGTNVRFIIHIDPDLKETYAADKLRITQVLNNLISNAVKFTPTGTVTLTAKVASNSNDDEQNVYFEVKDTGIGIREEKQAKIFESFTQADADTTRKYGGTGLGLTISRRLVQIMGGELQLKSKQDQGSIFSFTLPLSVINMSTLLSDDNAAIDLSELTDMHVLLAEDNPVNAMVAKQQLSKWNVNVTVAKNGVQALYLFSNNTFDLLLIDLEMPELDGYGVIHEIRQQDKNIPAFAFTASVFEDMEEKLRAHGFNGYLHKPFKPDQLYTKLLQSKTE
jgi:signal transduction histidine kinase